VERREKRSYSRCNDNDLKFGRCVVHNGKLQRESLTYTARVTYAGRELTRGEFYQLTLHGYNDKIRAIKDKKGTCTISLVPSVIAIAGAVFASGVAILGDRITEDDDKKLAYYGIGGGTFVLGALVSYPLGGYACTRADTIADTMGLHGLGASNERVFFSQDARAIETVVALADEFNRSPHQQTPGDDTAPGDTEPPAQQDAPKELPEAAQQAASQTGAKSAPKDTSTSTSKPKAAGARATGSADLVAALAADGRFATFLELVKASDISTVLATGDHTVFAVTDGTFERQLPGDKLAKLLANRTKLNEVMNTLVVEGIHAADELSAGTTLTTLAGGKLTTGIKKGRLFIGRDEATLPAILASNGIIYVFER
jgi:uncharacterized surface protein with fasciclin (FAS1) repeats